LSPVGEDTNRGRPAVGGVSTAQNSAAKRQFEMHPFFAHSDGSITILYKKNLIISKKGH